MCSRDHQLSELPIPIIHSGVLINRIQNIILYNFQLKLAMSHNNVCWSNLNLLLIIPVLASIIFGYPNFLAAHAFSSTIESIPKIFYHSNQELKPDCICDCSLSYCNMGEIIVYYSTMPVY
jgi:hypothetical protein